MPYVNPLAFKVDNLHVISVNVNALVAKHKLVPLDQEQVGVTVVQERLLVDQHIGYDLTIFVQVCLIQLVKVLAKEAFGTVSKNVELVVLLTIDDAPDV